MENKFSFFSTSLQKVHSESEVVIADHLQKIINVSNDINNLEDKLKKSAIPFRFIYVFLTEKSIFSCDLSKDPDSFGPFEDIERSTDHCLVWGKHNNNDYRLSYQFFQTDYVIELDHDKQMVFISEERDPVLKLVKPLIETKAYFRLKVENELPDFYRSLVNSLTMESEKEIIVVDSPSNKLVGSALSLYAAKSASHQLLLKDF